MPPAYKNAQKGNLMASKGWKKWTDEETEILKNNWGVLSYKEIARLVNKPIPSVKCRANYIGLSHSFESATSVTIKAVYDAVWGYNPSTQSIEKLVSKGFPLYYKVFGRRRYRLVELEKFWEWLKEHQNEISFLRFEKYSLGPEPKWVDEKRKADWKEYNNKRWSVG